MIHLRAELMTIERFFKLWHHFYNYQDDHNLFIEQATAIMNAWVLHFDDPVLNGDFTQLNNINNILSVSRYHPISLREY